MNGDTVFDFERQLWDQVVLSELRDGQETQDAIASADQVVTARRKFFAGKEAN